MATLRHADSRRLYSWWWDSHISPKNSRWLQDNLSDMDMKIKAMIKLIEEDADSFARRAEMYYKKRPELMRLVEEFYRAYRALAERYDHATGALRQAHRTIAEAFPNQMPTFSDDMSSASSITDMEYAPETSYTRSNFGFGDSPNDPFGKRNGIYSDDGDSLADRKGSKQTSGMFTSQDEGFFSNASEKKIKKALAFLDDGVEASQLSTLQEKISQLTSENESLKSEVNLGSEKSSNLENQVKQLQEAHSNIDSQKEEAILQFQECLKKVVELEAQIEVYRKVNAELLDRVEKLSRNEEACRLLEEENQILTIKVDNLEKKSNNLQEDQLHKKEEIEKLKGLLNSEHIRTAEAESAVKTLKQLQTKSEEQLKSSLLEVQHGSQMLKEMESMKKTLEEEIGLLREKNDSLCIELTQKQEEMNKLSFALQNECRRSIEMEALLQCLENLHGQSQKELKLFMLDVQSSIHDLKEVEMNKQFLVEELSKIKEDIQHLNEKNTSLTIMMKFLQEKVLFLIDVQEQLQNKVALQSDEKSVLLRDLSSMKVEIDNLCQRQKTVAEQMEAVGFSEDSFQSSVKCLQNENVDLKETCKRHEAEKLLLFERSAHMDKISEENRALENSLSDTTAELQGLREKIVVLQQSHDSLQDTNESLTNEKNNLILKVNNIEGHVEELAKKNTFLECSLSDANADLEDLRGELKNMEDSYHIVYNDKCSLDVEKNTLLSKVEDMGLSLENLKKRYEMLRNEHLNLEKEKEMTRRQLIDLQNCFNQEKLDNEEFKHCNNAKLALLESQISKLNESNLCQEEQLRNEQEKLFHLEVERFILQRSILDLINGNLSLKNKCNELELDNKGHKEKSMMLSSVNERLEMEMQTTSKDLTKEKEKYELLHDKHLELEKEKEIADRQLTDLHDCFNREKKDNENFKHCSNARLADLESQIIKLNERNHLNEIQLRNEQNKLFDIEIGRFVLQRCTSDLINGDLSLKNKCHVLEQDNKGLKEKNMMLSSENRRLEMEMQIILKALTKESCDFADKEEPCLQHILNNINELQNSVLVAKNEHLDLFVENSINDILFREIARSAVELESNSRSLEQMHRLRTDELLGLQSERCNLLQSTKHLEQNLEASYQAQKMIEEKLEILGRELLASKESEFMLHGDNNKLAKEIGLLSSQLCKLGTEKDNLQEEIDAVLQKNVALDCLSVMLKQFNVETSSKLEALLKDFTCTSDSKNHLVGKVKELDETVQVIEAENSQLKSLLLKFEEFKCHTAVLAVESNITNNINNELNCQIYQMNQQIEDMEKLLTQKKEALLDVCMILQKLRKVEEKLICNLKDTKLELDDVKCTKENLEKKILMLSKEIISKDTDIARFLEDNATLVLELAKSQKENEELKTNGSHLQKEIHYCESEVTTLLNEFQIATVQAALFEDKLLQLMGDHENVAVENFVQRRNVDDEISQNDAYVEKLNMEVDDLKGQNRIMKSELDGYLPAIRSLQKSLCGLESFVRSSQKDGNMRGQKLQDPLNFNDKLPKGILELEMLQIKVDSIREAFVHHQNQYVVHSLELTGKAYGDGTKAQEEKQIESGKPAAVDISEQVDKTEESEGVLQEVQISGNKDDLIMKDIQLDHALSLPKSERSVGPYTVVGSNALQTDDQMLELWQTDEWGHSDKSENPSAGSWIPSRHDGEVGRNENPTSELVVEKELGVDRLAMPNRNKENRQDWNKVLERLSSDAQRLTTLESGLCELKSKVERSVQMHPKNVEYDDIRGQLHEAEENILQLLDTNKKLIEKAETSSNNFTEPDLMNQRWRQVSGRARKGSEKIGRLELELQKLQYIFLKVEELDSQKTKAADRRSSVLLRDYLYGSNQSRKKNIYFCCFKPKTKAV